MNIFGSKSSHIINSKNCKVFFIFPKFLLYLIMFSEFCCAFGNLHFEKSSNTAKNFLEKMKKNLPISLLLKWPLMEPKMFIVQFHELTFI